MNINELFSGSSATATKTAASPNKELGQNDFLKLLVAQMKNQDPSNPTDNSEFLSQMAQFSMVSGIDDINNSFKGISSNLYATQAMQAATLVGKEVLSDTDTVSIVSGEGAGGLIGVPEFTDALNVQVRDAKGNLVKTILTDSFRAGYNEFEWDGTNDKGEVVPDGEYVVRATGLIENQQQALPVELYQKVKSVSVDRASSAIALDLGNDRQIGFSQITQFR